MNFLDPRRDWFKGVVFNKQTNKTEVHCIYGDTVFLASPMVIGTEPEEYALKDS